MTRILALLVSTFLLTAAFAQQPDSILRSAKKPALINPYKNLKISVFGRGQNHTSFGWGYGGGVEFRRFISLREYYFLEASYAQWQKSKEIKNAYNQDCSFDFTAKSFSLKLGRAIFGSQHVYIGAFFTLDAYLSERVPDQYFMYSDDDYVTVAADITSYTRKVVPFLGWNYKVKGWKFMFIEIGADYMFFSPLKPLRHNWRVPNKVSGFIYHTFSEHALYNFYGSIHFKL